jgi:hypothetical protein
MHDGKLPYVIGSYCGELMVMHSTTTILWYCGIMVMHDCCSMVMHRVTWVFRV